MPRVMQRTGERLPHQPRRGHGAVEPRQRHHVDDGGDASPLLADEIADCLIEGHLAEPLERLPSLSLSRSILIRLTDTSLEKRGMKKQDSPPLAWASTRKASHMGADKNHLWPLMA